MSGFPWTVLGIRETSDKGEIRRAYSARLKELDLDRQIAEYAELRQARDHALWLAVNPPQEDDDFGLGSLDDDEFDDFGEFDDFDDAPVPTTYDGGDDFDWEIRDGELSDGVYDGDLSFGTRPGEFDPLFSRREEPDWPDGWTELAALVFPGGMQSNEPFTPDEADEADAALDRLIAWAEEGDLERETTLDHNLAEMLAGGWPRSAPVVEKANAAFHWLGEAGGLDERPALQFLNARTEGMRFHDAVEQDGHPLHAAWRELQQPGKVSVLGRIKGNRSDIERLLQTIRGGFPELESLLDAQRVQSWDTPASDVVSWVVQRLFIAFLLVQLVRLVFFSDPAERDPNAEIRASAEEIAAAEAHADTVAADLFGEGYTMADVAKADAAYAVLLRERIDTFKLKPMMVKQRVRTEMRLAIHWTERDNVIALQRIYRDWLARELEESPSKCRTMQMGNFPEDSASDSPESVAFEQSLARNMLEAGDFHGGIFGNPDKEDATFAIPGTVIERAMARSGIPEEVFRARFKDVNSLRACEASIAVLDVILEDPERIGDDLLRGMW